VTANQPSPLGYAVWDLFPVKSMTIGDPGCQRVPLIGILPVFATKEQADAYVNGATVQPVWRHPGPERPGVLTIDGKEAS